MGVWSPSTALYALTALLLSQSVLGQLNPALANDPLNTNTGSNIFYFDSNSDCNGPIHNLFGIRATIRGSDLSSRRLGPTTCTMRLRSEGQFDGNVLDIEVKSMNIIDCTTQVAIYDGDGAQILLMSYDCRSSQNQNRKRFLTSGNTATFIMTRQNVNNFQFDIEITINPVRSGADPSYGDKSVSSDGETLTVTCDINSFVSGDIPASVTYITQLSLERKVATSSSLIAKYIPLAPTGFRNLTLWVPYGRNWTIEASGGGSPGTVQTNNKNTIKITLLVRDASCEDVGTYRCNATYQLQKDGFGCVSRLQSITFKVSRTLGSFFRIWCVQSAK